MKILRFAFDIVLKVLEKDAVIVCGAGTARKEVEIESKIHYEKMILKVETARLNFWL